MRAHLSRRHGSARCLLPSSLRLGNASACLQILQSFSFSATTLAARQPAMRVLPSARTIPQLMVDLHAAITAFAFVADPRSSDAIAAAPAKAADPTAALEL